MAWHMAGKTITMLQLMKVLQNKLRGKGDLTTAKSSSVTRKAIKGYLHRLAVSNIDFEELLKLDDAQLWELGNPGAGLNAAQEVVDSRLAALFSYLERYFPTWATRV